ncbi:uncharacterized protein LOC127854583 [Dreissena polymorpha]|uniref:uncharacterized protein LOC127854583 n=1 Tax=Dreissena polymorpha TaxID=45954 RepID=UPI002264EE1E|nr:uncharacterized protein LOC127854583 [Dreissena polymorpha]
MRECTDDCPGLLYNELERNCTLCASVKFETGNPEKKAIAFEKVQKKCDDKTPYDSTKTPQTLCPPFENKKNGKMVGESLIEGATKNLTCHPGYSPRERNNVVSKCKNSKWTKITECAIVCPTFENNNNGKVEGDSLFEGATRNLTCNPGYSPRDSNAVLSLCQNGQWTKITECIKVCPPFENNSKGKVAGDSLFEGATRNLTCDSGYSPRDDNILVSQYKWEYRAFEFNQSIYVSLISQTPCEGCGRSPDGRERKRERREREERERGRREREEKRERVDRERREREREERESERSEREKKQKERTEDSIYKIHRDREERVIEREREI